MTQMFQLRDRAKKRMADLIRHQVQKISSGEVAPLFGDSYWHSGPNLWEPAVLLAIKDMVKPGGVTFDVGGNMGGLTSALSRLVGPKGVVCTFEASPRIVGYLNQNIARQGHRNVTVYHRAVYSNSNEILQIYDGDHLNDSIYAKNSPTKVSHPVKTLALDDFCSLSGLVPDFIKMDIEGAEFDALLGSEKIIQEKTPHLVLEQQADDIRCFEFLMQRGYVAIDLSTYRLLRSLSDFTVGAPLKNVLFVHGNRISDLPYDLPVQRSEVLTMSRSDFLPNHLNGYTSGEIRLTAGRYLIELDFTATGTSNNMMCGVRFDGADFFRYHGYSKLIADSYKDWVIDLPRSGPCYVYFDFLQESSDPSMGISSAKFWKLNVANNAWASLVFD